MDTVTTRALKQNPAAAIRQVLETGEPAILTAHGRSTGVMMVPQEPSQRSWVPGQALLDGLSAGSESQVRAWQHDLDSGRSGEFGRDLFR